MLFRASKGLYRTAQRTKNRAIRDSRGSIAAERWKVATRLTTEQSEALAKDFRSGVRVTVLASKYRVTRATVHEHLNKHGLRRPRNILDSERVDRAVELYQAGMTLQEVSDAIGSNRYTVQQALQTRGVPRRPRGTPVAFNK